MSNLIPEGTHEVHVVETYLSESKEKKTPCLVVVFEDDQMRRISHNLWLSEKAVPGTLDVLEKVLGWDGGADDYRIEAINGTDRLIQRPAQVVVAPETYEGKTFLKVKYVNEPGYMPGAPQLDDAKTKALGATLRAAFIKAKGPQANRAPSRATPAAPAKVGPRGRVDTRTDGDFDDSIPF
jgi:hypothetical protein